MIHPSVVCDIAAVIAIMLATTRTSTNDFAVTPMLSGCFVEGER